MLPRGIHFGVILPQCVPCFFFLNVFLIAWPVRVIIFIFWERVFIDSCKPSSPFLWCIYLPYKEHTHEYRTWKNTAVNTTSNIEREKKQQKTQPRKQKMEKNSNKHNLEYRTWKNTAKNTTVHLPWKNRAKIRALIKWNTVKEPPSLTYGTLSL